MEPTLKGNYRYPQPGEIKTLPSGEILMAFGASAPTEPPRCLDSGILQKISADSRLLWTKSIYPGENPDFRPTVLPRVETPEGVARGKVVVE